MTFVLVPCIIPKDSLLTDLCPHSVLCAAAVRVGYLTPSIESNLPPRGAQLPKGKSYVLLTLEPVKGSVVTQVGETVCSTTTLLLEDFSRTLIY